MSYSELMKLRVVTVLKFLRYPAIFAFLLLYSAACSKSPDPEQATEASEDSSGTEEAVTFIDHSFDPQIPKPPKEPTAEDTAPEEEKPRQPYEFEGNEGSVAADILAMPDSSAKYLAMTALMAEWIQYDAEGALKFGESLQGNMQMKRAYHQGIGPQLAKSDPDKLLNIIEDGNWWPDQWKDQRQALRGMTHEDFDRAAQFYADTAFRKQHKEEAFNFTRRIAEEQSIAAAIDFVNEIENEVSKTWATRGLIQKWMDSDTNEAVAYVNRLSDQASKDQGALGVIDAVWKTNPDDSILWASTIKDPELRQKTYSNLAKAWQRRGNEDFLSNLLGNRKLSNGDISAIQEALKE